MPINEESKQAYLQARDTFVESYKDFLRKLLGLLDEAEQSTDNADVKQDVNQFSDEVRELQRHIEDYMTEEERAKQTGGSASSSVTPRDPTSQEESLGRASSPGEQADQPPPAQDDSTAPVPLLGGVQTTTTTGSDQQQQDKSASKSKSTSREEDGSAEELQAEVESQPSQLSPTSEDEPSAADDMPEVLPPPVSDDGRVVSAFCAFRYHKAEFRQLFMRQSSGSNSNGNNNNNNCSVELLGNHVATMAPPPPTWLASLARCTLQATKQLSTRSKSRQAVLANLRRRHLNRWLQLADWAEESNLGEKDPASVFEAIPQPAEMPRHLAEEVCGMLQALDLLCHHHQD